MKLLFIILGLAWWLSPANHQVRYELELARIHWQIKDLDKLVHHG